MNKVRVIVKEPGKPAEERSIYPDEIEKIIDGPTDRVRFTDNLLLFVHDYGKVINLPENFIIRLRYGLDVVHGTAVAAREELDCAGFECGLVDMTCSDMVFCENFFKESAIENQEKLYAKVKADNPIITTAKPGVEIKRLVQSCYGGLYNLFGLDIFDWRDLDGVLDYLYGLREVHGCVQAGDIIRLIESNAEVRHG